MLRSAEKREPRLPSATLISVVVCTRNRAARLPKCIDALLAMRVPEGTSCELIFVDNNSTDNTKQVVDAAMKSRPKRIRYVFEPVTGASVARNSGITAAQGDIIAITDDDCIGDPGWLEAIWREFEADPSIDMLGGRVELYNPEDLSTTTRTFTDRVTATRDTLLSRFVGCNLALRRRVLDVVGVFDPALGPGTPVIAAEDLDLIYRMFHAGCKMVYAPDVLLYHDHGRRTEADRAKLTRGYFIGRGAFYLKFVLRNDREVMRMAYWEIVGLVKEIATGRSVRQPLKVLWHLLLGAASYPWARLKRQCAAWPPWRTRATTD